MSSDWHTLYYPLKSCQGRMCEGNKWVILKHDFANDNLMFSFGCFLLSIIDFDCNPMILDTPIKEKHKKSNVKIWNKSTI